eukprot:CAMPEP_0198225310 /NCGR_PEP_ID=MMETSP1445-20131203/100661_1 /TAXON_ID=36898 /ORGANISM="Pyramimonas sp., Strain CCMP2087" /LENGTH=97 /DNA_ID=CAMNT_0043904789 /DNA_START=17 /DNA_END=307 /DNA_ORIENTATION=-
MPALGPAEQELVVQRVLEAKRKHDYIKVLGLTRPKLQDGEVVWDYGDTEIARHFRLMSLQVHPDKNQSEKAPLAFRALTEAQEALHDTAKRRECLFK